VEESGRAELAGLADQGDGVLPRRVRHPGPQGAASGP
jgi:hypothetical protein